MAPHALLALLTLGLFVGACRADDPALPDGMTLTASDWIPGRSKSSFTSQGQPVVIENVGRYPLHIGTGPDKFVLVPGALYETDGQKTQIYNPAGDQALIRIHAADPGGISGGLDVRFKHKNEVRTIHATYAGGAQ